MSSWVLENEDGLEALDAAKKAYGTTLHSVF